MQNSWKILVLQLSQSYFMENVEGPVFDVPLNVMYLLSPNRPIASPHMQGLCRNSATSKQEAKRDGDPQGLSLGARVRV
jgi:hypothetical protein